MTIFDKNGHVTDEAVKAMVEYELNDEDTLLFCEHMSECDECSERYMQALEQEELMTPSEELTKNIEEKTYKEKKSGKIITLQIFKFVVAATLTFIIWGGMMDLKFTGMPNINSMSDGNMSMKISQSFSNFTNELQGGLTKSMNSASGFLRYWEHKQTKNAEQSDNIDK